MEQLLSEVESRIGDNSLNELTGTYCAWHEALAQNSVVDQIEQVQQRWRWWRLV